jgi:hypothetical protein
MTFLFSEDAALRNWLNGVTVTDQKATGDATPRQVRVWFGQPDQELREQSYPYITLDMVDINRDAEREMRGDTSAAYLRPANLPSTSGFRQHLPIPVNIDYQVTVYSRNPVHDRQIMMQLLAVKLPLRFGQLELDDGTIRRLEVMDVSKRNATEQAKRLFVNSITVRISSEIPEITYNELFPVHTVVGGLTPINLPTQPGTQRITI